MNVKTKYPHLKVVSVHCPPYPNAADHRYFAQKALDIALGLVSCMGFAVAMAFLVTMA